MPLDARGLARLSFGSPFLSQHPAGLRHRPPRPLLPLLVTPPPPPRRLAAALLPGATVMAVGGDSPDPPCQLEWARCPASAPPSARLKARCPASAPPSARPKAGGSFAPASPPSRRAGSLRCRIKMTRDSTRHSRESSASRPHWASSVHAAGIQVSVYNLLLGTWALAAWQVLFVVVFRSHEHEIQVAVEN